MWTHDEATKAQASYQRDYLKDNFASTRDITKKNRTIRSGKPLAMFGRLANRVGQAFSPTHPKSA